jgi:hypothetical protein
MTDQQIVASYNSLKSLDLALSIWYNERIDSLTESNIKGEYNGKYYRIGKYQKSYW